jgi:CRP-like cAMP-binding protein
MTLFIHRRDPSSRTSRYADLAFFVGWSDRDLSRLDSLAEIVEYEPGEIITTQGMPTGREFLVITCGRATVTAGDGQRQVLEAGESIGAEDMLLRDGRSRTSVVADTYLTALLLGPREFHGLLAEAPSMGRRLALLLADRLASIDRTIAQGA